MSIPTLAQEMVLESIKIEGLKPGAIVCKKIETMMKLKSPGVGKLMQTSNPLW